MKNICFLFTAVLFYLGGSAQVINFPDANFKARLLQANTDNTIAKDLGGIFFKIDANNNAEIEISEALNVSQLLLNSSTSPDQAFSNVSGIQNFSNLLVLDVASNNLTTLNLSGLPGLTKLYMARNQITLLDVSGFSALTLISANLNDLTSINVSGCIALEKLYVDNNALTTLDLNGLSALTYLRAEWNQLTAINTSGVTAMATLGCYNNDLTSLDVSQMPNLVELTCGLNQIGFLDISNSPNVNNFEASNNQLIAMNLKNGTYVPMASFNFSNNPNLRSICVDPSDINNVTTRLAQYANSICMVNSYCSFAPGGSDYSISGINSYDIDNNGCSTADISFANLRFSISDGITTGIIIPTSAGTYDIPLPMGSYTLTPIAENPSYFEVSPTSVTVDFSSQPNPFIQNFCFSTPNGDHPDLYIFVCPLDVPRPGFNSRYKIIYQNVGTIVQSGNVAMNFDGTILDFVTANTTVTSETENSLTWNFINLLPLERREILVTFNVNSPIEIPPVVSGTAINYQATISSLLIDQTPYNNSFTLHQVAVNSFDPNDKTCLDGPTIPLSQVGKEVHYKIRFENTGTANAENIVVRDAINLSKFDINSLVPVDGSHPFRTRINDNEVVFYFENINLPFDDANNDGYVAFKIKTKPTLVAGSIFTNTASIYFDYNFPIITDPSSTTVAVLANADFDFEQYFKIYPNPAKETLNIETKKTIEVSSINIYNTLGQVVLVIPNAQQTKSVDVSSLKTGNYFLKILTDKGNSSVKFVKM